MTVRGKDGADAHGNGRHGYPKDWPGAYASSLKKQIFNEGRGSPHPGNA